MPTILITGASQGIGRAVAVAFAGEPDARLALVSRNEKLLDETRALCRELGAEAEIFVCDVTDESEVERVAAEIRSRWGTPDVLVNNAGIFAPGSVMEMSVQTFRDQIEGNLTSAFIVTHAFLRDMVERGSGHIFFMASVASIKPYPSGVAYGAAKHGMLGLARTLREETKEHGIRVTAIMPGATYTRSWQGSGLPPSRFMPPEDIGRTVVETYRLSERSVVEEIIIRPQLGDI